MKAYLLSPGNKRSKLMWTTKAYDSYEVAHRAAEKLANKHIPAGNAFIYVVDGSGERV